MASATYQVVRDAIINKQIITATYNGHTRFMCPHAIGLGPTGREQALFYQFGGTSSSGISPPGSPNNWRCIPIAGLSNVKVSNGPWHTAPNHSRPQTCVRSVDVEVTH